MKKLSTWVVGVGACVLFAVVSFWDYLPPLPAALRLAIILPAAPAGTSEPLIVTGRVSEGDFLFVKHVGPGQIVFGYDSWARGGPESPPVAFTPGTRHTLDIAMPSLSRVPGSLASAADRLRVTFNGTLILDAPVSAYSRLPSRLWLGHNPLGGTLCGPEFHGQLFSADSSRPLHGNVREFLTRGERLRGWLWFGRWQVVSIALASAGLAWFWARFSPERFAPVRRALAGVPSVLHAHRTFAATAALCAVAFTAMISQGSFRLIHQESFGDFYDFQATSLLQGRLDVPEQALQGESFIHEGKIYGYFGPTPALLRLPFVIFGLAFGELSRAAMLVFYIGTLVAAYLIFLDATRLLRPAQPRPAAWQTILFTAHLGLGSTVFFLGSRAYIYHEAILCGIMFALFSCWCALRHLAHPAGRWWLGALVLGTLSVHARPPAGLFALTVLGCVAATHLLRSPSSVLRPLLIGALSVAGVASFNALSYAKFRTIEGCPLRLNVQYSPRRLAHIDGKQFHLSNVPYGLASYFTRSTVEAEPRFPWLYVGRPIPPREFPAAKLDLPDRTLALPYGMTGLFVLATIGCAWAGAKLPSARAPVAILWASVVPLSLAMFAAIATAERYTGDFVPWIVCAAAFGLAAPGWRAVGTAALFGATLWACSLTLATTLHYQGALVWGVPTEVQQNYQHLRQRVDAWFDASRSTPP